LSALVAGRAAGEVARIKSEAEGTFGDQNGKLNLELLADPPRVVRRAPSEAPDSEILALS
jgi:hypothetical protein